MDNIFQKIPFLRITLAFAIGIIAGNYFEINRTFLALCIAIILLLLIVLNRKYTYKTASVFGVFALLLFIALGNFIFVNHNKIPYFFEDGVYLGTILESPQEKQNSYKSVIRNTAFKKGDSIFQTDEKLVVYFSKSDNVKQLKPGNTILFRTTPQAIKNYGNPYEFDYKNYLQKKGIYRQVYLANESWEPTQHQTQSVQIYSELIRDKLLHIYRTQNLGTNETEILSALTLGYKRDLEPETKRIFSAAGAMHVLAVSGLHVGIIFMVFMYVFGFLRRQKTGKYLFVISAIILLWVYAFITGLSPSVMRAASMFTILIIGSNINRRANIYNSLAASAIFLLIINPNNLFEVGFQLSYAAVFGIVFLQPKFEKIWHPKNKVIRFFWTLLTVSIAAQLATFPLSSYYFGQFPSFFWLTNLIVIPAVTILIPLGILLLIFSKVSLLAAAIALVIKWLIKTIYLILQSIEHLPYSILEISFTPAELFCLLTSLSFIFIFIVTRKSLHVKLALLTISILFTIILFSRFNQFSKREIIIYNNVSNSTFQLIAGRKNYVISANEITREDFFFHQIEDVKRKKRLSKPIFLLQSDSFEDSFLLLKNGFCVFEGKSIYYGTELNNLPQKIIPNFHITKSNFQYKNPEFNQKTKVISTQKVFQKNNNNPIYSLKTAGAFHKIW